MFEITHAISDSDHVYLKKSWSILVKRAAEEGIKIDADGNFNGKATGTIKLMPNSLHIVIMEKPFYIPETLIRKELSSLINGWLDG